MQSTHMIVAGAGIAGLGAALVLARQGMKVTVLEKAAQISEVGAGLQLGPNAVRVLDSWGLMEPLLAVAAEPERLLFLDAHNGRELGRLSLGSAMRTRYGWPNLTIRRADLQNLLLNAVRGQANVDIQLNQSLARVEQGSDQVSVYLADGRMQRADGLIGCDGIRSRTRMHLRPGDGAPRPTGHIAWRTLIPVDALPAGVRADQTSVWVGPKLHAVAYPVRSGQTFNVVIFTHAERGQAQGGPSRASAASADEDWDLEAVVQTLRTAVASAHPVLRALVDAAPQWRRWSMNDRPALLDPRGYAQGCVAILGDAAHPMRPHMAQGAAMGLEDAQVLGRVMKEADVTANASAIAPALTRYADLRWRRNARVQLRAQFNGAVMQSGGVLRWGRNLAMAVRGEKLLDMPWLYGFQA